MKENFIEDLCEWLKNTKGITKIDLEDLASYIPEYENYLEENEEGWTADYIKCDLCSHKCVCVYPEELDRLECPNCNNMVMFGKL
jgi:hypothetical protein